MGLCFQAELAAAVTRLCARILSGFQSRRSNPDAPGRPRPAAIAFIQRFSDGLGPWFHIHFLLPDGVFRQLPQSLDVPFEHHPPPTPREVESVLADIARRAGALVVRGGGRLQADTPAVLRCVQQRATPIRKPARTPVRPQRPHPLRAEQDRFSLHAATVIAPNQPQARQRICRHLTRQDVTEERLQRLPDGRVAVKLKRPRRGVQRFIFQPVALLARLCALIPPPYFNLVRYFGPLSSASPLRPYAVRSPPEPKPQRPTAPERPRRMRRADLLARVFGFNALACSCGGYFRPIAVITQRSRHPGHPGRHGPVKRHLSASPTPPAYSRQLTPDTANGPTAAPACGDGPVRDNSPNHTLQQATNLKGARFLTQDALMTADKRARRAKTAGGVVNRMRLFALCAW